MDPFSLRRPRALLGSPVLPPAEVRIPVGLTPAQAAAYRTVLTRSYELLSDPKPSRHSGYRAAQLRTVAQELRNVCCHPALSDWAERSGSGGETAPAASPAAAPAADAATAAGAAAGTAVQPAGQAAAAAATTSEEGSEGGEGGQRLTAERLVRGSAKLALLDTMLAQLHAGGKRVLVLAQSPKALDAVEALARERYGAAPAGGAATGATSAAAPAGTSYERVDATTKTAARQEAVARFNAACAAGDASSWLFLQHTRSCGVGTDLPGIDAVIFLDSDWSARKDAQVRLSACIGAGCWGGREVKEAAQRLGLLPRMGPALMQCPASCPACWACGPSVVSLSLAHLPPPSPLKPGTVACAAGGVPRPAACLPPVLLRHLRGALATAVGPHARPGRVVPAEPWPLLLQRCSRL